MIRRFTYLFAGILIAVFVSIGSWSSMPVEPTRVVTEPHIVRIDGERVVAESLRVLGESNELERLTARGGIIPHHLLAEDLIVDFVSRLSRRDVDRIVLIGPNHTEGGTTSVITSDRPWRTPFGSLNADNDAVEQFLRLPFVSERDSIIENEHSITAILPYIRSTLPGVEIVPLVLKARMTSDELQSLSTAIAQVSDDRTVVLLSMDFSHDLYPAEARKRDAVSLEAIERFDEQFFLRLGTDFNEYVDSPSGIALFLMTMEKLGATTINILKHTDGSLYTGQSLMPISSYFEMVFS